MHCCRDVYQAVPTVADRIALRYPSSITRDMWMQAVAPPNFHGNSTSGARGGHCGSAGSECPYLAEHSGRSCRSAVTFPLIPVLCNC